MKPAKTHVFAALGQPRITLLIFVFYEKEIKITEIKQSNINLIKLLSKIN